MKTTSFSKTLKVFASFLIVFSIVLTSLPVAEAATTKATIYRLSTDSYLYDKTASSRKRLLMIKTGTVVSSTYASGAFRRVTYAGKTGYVASKYLTLYEKKQTVSGQRYLVLKKTPIKKTAVDTATTIGTLNEEDVYYTSQHVTNPLGETWYQISKEGKTGFVLANQATPIAYESQSNLSLKTTAATTIRSYAGPSYATVQTIPSNTVIKISGRIGNWYRVSYNGKTGYAASSTFTTLATKQKIAGARFELEKAVSIKSSPDAKASTLTTLQSGDIYYTTQLVTSNGQQWHRVSKDGKTGYIPVGQGKSVR